ncbi:MAG TPA: transglutaminase-like domain-containing protein [Candidatus Nanoarchaeia archaeon]|nr:transglutaminase-like domain-containing protein [Candidatus Nanoarchaeia archaeon]
MGKYDQMILVVVLGILFSSFAAAELYTKDKMKLDMTIHSTLDFKKTPNELHLFLYDFPKIADHQVSIPGKIDGNAIYYYWKNPVSPVSYSVRSAFDTTQNIAKVRDKILISDSYSEELENYTRSSPHINPDDPAIAAMARDIVGNEDDTMIALYKLATWVEQNVQYDISTLTEEVSQTSSWVLEYRTGVCDEMTSLFIAFARSLGIPARFVSGISYTTAEEFDRNWLPHGWAEVYVDSVGWVPFDITYGELGYVDATHIKLHDSVDSQVPSLAILSDADVDSEDLLIDVTIVNEGLDSDAPVAFTVEKKADMLVLSLENKMDYYAATTIYIGVPAGVSVEKDTYPFMLYPLEKKIFEVPVHADAQEGLQHQIDVYNERNERKSVIWELDEIDAPSSVATQRQEKPLIVRLWLFVKRFAVALF